MATIYRKSEIPEHLASFFCPAELGLERAADCLGWATGVRCGECYVCAMREVFREVWRVLRDDGVAWLNLGDSFSSNSVIGRRDTTGEYAERRAALFGSGRGAGNGPREYQRTRTPAGMKPKDLMLMPHRTALALQADGWYVRMDCVWDKPNPMPESVTDRPTRSHEYVFLLAKAPAYFYDAEAVREAIAESTLMRPSRLLPGTGGSAMAGGGSLTPHTGLAKTVVDIAAGRNRRSVFRVTPRPFTDWTENVRRVRVEPDAADDDTTRIESPDCPRHAGRSVLLSSALCGEREAGSPSHTGRNGDGPASVRAGDSAATETPRASGSAVDSSGSPDLSRSRSATARSNQSRRTAPAPATSQPYTLFAQTSDGIPDTEASPGCDGPDPSTDGHSISACALLDREHSEIEHRTAHTESLGVISASEPPCTCEYYKEITEKTSHFATMAPDLAELCIRAGTSERGCCPACLAPYRRVIERGSQPPEPAHRNPAKRLLPGQAGNVDAGNMGFRASRLSGQEMSVWRAAHPDVTTGWAPGCKCDAGEPEPCRVLDPFSGAATTGVVAGKLGRDYVGVELNPTYNDMAERRILREVGPLLVTVERRSHDAPTTAPATAARGEEER